MPCFQAKNLTIQGEESKTEGRQETRENQNASSASVGQPHLASQDLPAASAEEAGSKQR